MERIAHGELRGAEGGAVVPEGEFPVLVPRVLIERTRTGALIDLLRIKLGFPREVFASAAFPVIEGYAGFVQLLPAPESRHHAPPGGRFSHGLEVALRALDHRRGQILPRGAAPEVIGAHAHRWTYAVFVAALLYDLGNIATSLRVLMRVEGREPRPWEPLHGSMLTAGASSYRVGTVEGDAVRDDRHRALGWGLFEQCVPAFVHAWLAEDAALMSELRAWLSMVGSAPRGAISELVLRAGEGSTARAVRGHAERATHVSRNAPSRTAEQGGETDPEDDEAEALEEAAEDVTRSAPSVGRAPIADTSAPSAPAVAKPVASQPELAGNIRASEIARSFIDWLKRGIAEGTIRANEAAALVHGVHEGMLLVSPRIFREFSKQLAKDARDGIDGQRREGNDAAKWVQRQVLRAGWHLQADRGINILTYEVMRGDSALARLSGVVIRNPAQFIDPPPAVNPVLVRAADVRQRA